MAGGKTSGGFRETTQRKYRLPAKLISPATRIKARSASPAFRELERDGVILNETPLFLFYFAVNNSAF